MRFVVSVLTMRRPSPRTLRLKWFLGETRRQFAHGLLASLRSHVSPTGIIWGVVGVLAAAFFGGQLAMMVKVGAELGAISGAVATVGAVIIANLAAAPFRAHSEHMKNGRWDGDEYIYNKKRFIFSKRLLNEDMGKTFPIDLQDIPPHAFVRYEIDFDNHLWTGTMGPYRMTDESRMVTMGRYCGASLFKNSVARLSVWSANEAAASTLVRVWIHSWHAGEVPL
jgi:hypothetical protein